MPTICIFIREFCVFVNVLDESSKIAETDPDSSQTRRIGSTTITPVGRDSYTLNDEDGDMEDRDEASGADEDVDELFTSDEVSFEVASYAACVLVVIGELKRDRT